MLKAPPSIHKPATGVIFYNRFIRYMKIGAFLHLMALVGMACFYASLKLALFHFSAQQQFLGVVWAIISFCFFTMPFFAQFDAHGRYQNYKQIKDVLCERGYDSRLIRPFMYSKCQRDAVLVASEDLNCKREVLDFFYQSGYRRYHILPDAFVKNPLVLFHKLFWKRILFTKTYKLKNFYW